MKAFEKAVDFSNKSDGDSYLWLAKIHWKQKNNKEAIIFAKNAIDHLKAPFEAYIQRGISQR